MLLYGKFPTRLQPANARSRVVDTEIRPRRAGNPLAETKINFAKEFNWDARSRERGLTLATKRACPPPYKHPQNLKRRTGRILLREIKWIAKIRMNWKTEDVSHAICISFWLKFLSPLPATPPSLRHDLGTGWSGVWSFWHHGRGWRS